MVNTGRKIEFQIRQLKPDDVHLMKDLLDCFGEAFDEMASYRDYRPDDGYLRELLSGDSFIALVALVDNIVVGGLASYELKKFEQRRSEIYIYDLAVAERYRRQGVATGLIDRLKLIAKNRGAWVVFVQADYVDEPAIKLYSKLGIREDVLHFDIPLDDL